MFQEGLTLYWRSLITAAVFTSNKSPALRLNTDHWFVLGVLLGHATLNHFAMFVEQPMCFFKVTFCVFASLR